MKRSEINAAIRWGKDFLAANNIRLPAMAYWSLDDWRRNAGRIETVRRTELGWDITDFGSGDFAKTGAKLATDVHVFMDGIKHVVKAGEEIVVAKGNSVTLSPYIAHVFGPRPGTGDCIAGEVSKVNDDHTDNCFIDKIARFADIEEDEPALHPLCNEYGRLA